MELKEYKHSAMSTCTPSSFNFDYMFCNLVGEVGEFGSKVAKAIRKEEAHVNEAGYLEVFGELERNLKLEAGDILWQLAGLVSVMGWDLEEIAQMNLDKLKARKQAGTIVGSGDGITAEERGCE